MKREQSFLVKLTQDVIISASSASEGHHRSLDYLPGSLFLGLAATRGYTELSPDDSWTVFHSGKVRFLDALPYMEGQPSHPMPLSFHSYKGEQALNDKKTMLEADKVFDPSMPFDGAQAGQPSQLRGGYITLAGSINQPKLNYRMKTAIDPSQGRAAKSQLFGYQALEAGQQFLFTLQADSVSDKLFEKSVKWLTGAAQLGRSRTAQYGGVTITPLKALKPSSISNQPKTLTLWLQSDLALVDSLGQPSLTPHPYLFDLPPGSRWSIESSFIRTRRYSQYNAKRRCFDTERHVINRGSVLRFELSQPLTDEALTGLSVQGLYQESGLGQMSVNSPILAHRHPSFSKLASNPKLSTKGEAPLAQPQTPLINLLALRSGSTNQHKHASELAARLFESIVDAVQESRQWLGLVSNQPLPSSPGRSQWGSVKALSSDYRSDPSQLWKVIFSPESGAIRPRSGWDLSIGPQQTLASRVQQLCEQQGLEGHALLADVLGELATLGLSERWQEKIMGTKPQAQEVSS